MNMKQQPYPKHENKNYPAREWRIHYNSDYYFVYRGRLHYNSNYYFVYRGRGLPNTPIPPNTNPKPKFAEPSPLIGNFQPENNRVSFSGCSLRLINRITGTTINAIDGLICHFQGALSLGKESKTLRISPKRQILTII